MLISDVAIKHGIPSDLLYAQVRQESNFNPLAVSKCGARGLLQIMPDTARDLGVKLCDLDVPEKNLNAGARYLRQCHNAMQGFAATLAGADNICADADYWRLALAAYNGGRGYIIRAMKLCQTDGVAINFDNVATRLSDRRCVVRGKRPDHKQITEYVAKIWTRYQGGIDHVRAS
jgi:soluble lytic murein transglycosylase-like protein